MDRRVVIGSLVAVLALLPTGAVHGVSAASTSTTTVSRTGLPTSFSLAGIDSSPETCSSSTGTASATHVTGPSTPPLGLGSLALSFTAGIELTDALSVGASALTTFKVSSLGTPSRAHATILADTPTGGGWELTSALPPSGWNSTNVLTDVNMNWWFRTNSGQSWSVHDTGTYADFVTGDPGVQLTGIAITADTCSSGVTDTLNIDDLQVGISNHTTIYDFEVPLLADSLTSHVSTTTAVNGGRVTPRATFRSAGKPIRSESLTLWKKPAGTAGYRKVRTVKTGATGVATGPVQHPSVTTSYQWRFTSDGKYKSVRSKPTVVKVAPKVTLNLAASKVSHGQPVIASGVVSPKHPGATVTLWRANGRGKVRLGAAKVHRDGSYVVSATLPAGHYKLFVTIAKDSTNTAGTSPTRKVAVG